MSRDGIIAAIDSEIARLNDIKMRKAWSEIDKTDMSDENQPYDGYLLELSDAFSKQENEKRGMNGTIDGILHVLNQLRHDMTKRLRVFICGKMDEGGNATYAKRTQNAHAAAKAHLQVLELGHTPYTPHLTFFAIQDCPDYFTVNEGYTIERSSFINSAIDMLEHCDVILVISESEGTAREIEYAKEHKIPRLDSIEDLWHI